MTRKELASLIEKRKKLQLLLDGRTCVKCAEKIAQWIG